jgi:putative membrane protein
MKKTRIFTAIGVSLALLISLSPVKSFAQKSPKLSDPEIASVAVVANQNDIDFAAIAKQKSKNAEIINFAKTMANDHQSVIDQAVALVTKLKVTPKDNAVSQNLTADAAKIKKMLMSKSAAGFDKAYIDNEVAYHRAVISTVETVLVPQAANAELKALLQNVLPTLKAHLEHAEMVQKTVASK